MNLRMSFGSALIIVPLVLLTDSSIYAQNWPMVNLNKERTSWVSDETALYPPLQQKKVFTIKSTGSYLNLNSLTFYDNLLALAVGRYPNTLEVFDISSGDTLWTFEVPDSRASMNFACAQNDSMIFAGGQHGLELYALDKSTGEQKWSKPIGSLYTRNIILDNDYAYILGDSLYCLSIKDGATIWSQSIKIQGTPAVDDSYVYVVGIYKIQIVDKMTGELLWWKPNSERSLGGITLDDQCFYTFSNDTVFAYFKESKSMKWFYHSSGDTILAGGQNTFAITNSKLCFTIEGNGNGQAELVTLNKDNGEFVWDQTFSGNWVFTPTIANGIVYIVSVDGDLHGFDLENGAQKLYDNSFSYQYQPIVANHELYVATRNEVIVFGNNVTKINNINNSLPQGIELMQNYPNPFNPITTIKFFLPKDEFITLTIYDNLGKKIQTLLNEKKASGLHSNDFDGSELSSGLYYCKLVTGSFVSTKKLLLIK
jgi:outer membrane protein assembly factor BamB